MPEPWLFMLYLAGDNSLSEEMVLALQGLRDAGTPKGNAIVAEFDPSGVGLPTRRYDFTGIQPGGTASGLHHYFVNPALPPPRGYMMDETNTGNPKALSGFIKWAKQVYPGFKRHFLVLSGHGDGTSQDFLASDENSNDSLSMKELKTALDDARQLDGKGIDVLGMDACFMSMAEVAFELRGEVEYLVGAEGSEPEFGWPYHELLKASQQITPNHFSPPDLAKKIVELYVEYYSDYDRTAGRSVDLAAVAVDRLDGVAAALESVVDSVLQMQGGDK